MSEGDNIATIIKKCDSWSKVETSDDARFARYYVRVHFDREEDAKEFAVEMMMITSGQYEDVPIR